MDNLLRRTRNLLVNKFKGSFPVKTNEIVPVRELVISDYLELEVAQRFMTEKDEFPTKFMSNLSRLLTNRFKDVSQGQGPAWGKGKLDPYLKEVVGNSPIIGLKRSAWDTLRKNWRNQELTILNQLMGMIDFDELLVEGILSSLDELTPARITKKLLGKSKKFRYTTDFHDSWFNYLFHQVTIVTP